MKSEPSNRVESVIEGFGDEWRHFDQGPLSEDERRKIFDDYFAIFPWEDLPENAVGADVGCGSGRWAQVVNSRVGLLHCIEPSAAIDVARRNLSAAENVQFHHTDVENISLADESLDFAYCLGVLHHIPDTEAGLRLIWDKLKPGAPFLVYLYYAFDNRPWFYRGIWRLSDVVRRVLCRLPFAMRIVASQIIAFCVYWPLARSAAILEAGGHRLRNWPLAYYRDKSLYTMRTDALDRFGTRLEQRFTRDQIDQMLQRARYDGIKFSDKTPFWCAVAYKR